jgi:hypothetical protein
MKHRTGAKHRSEMKPPSGAIRPGIRDVLVVAERSCVRKRDYRRGAAPAAPATRRKLLKISFANE